VLAHVPSTKDNGAAGIASVVRFGADLEGTWQPRRFVSLVESAVGNSGVLRTVDGELPPYSADAQNILWHRIDMEQRGTAANTQDTCRPRLPHAMLNRSNAAPCKFYYDHLL
jgi:hypothetical protein